MVNYDKHIKAGTNSVRDPITKSQMPQSNAQTMPTSLCCPLRRTHVGVRVSKSDARYHGYSVCPLGRTL